MSDIDDEDISLLEDVPEEPDTIVIASKRSEAAALDAPLYRLRLPYSHESFLAIYGGSPLVPGSMVVVPTKYGMDLAKVLGPVGCKRCLSEVVQVERPATKEDLDRAEKNSVMEGDAFNICKERIKSYGLDMKLVQVHFLLEEAKILFFFTAETRIDFRELVKDLVNIFRTRIELRQIGVRDEARIVCGLGVCGRGYCCNTVSDKLKPVSIKMAKDQNLAFNSMKISGPCGRLLCCLSFEHNFYGEQVRLVPQTGSRIHYENATWTVAEVNILAGNVRINDSEGRSITLPSGRFEKVDNRWQVKP